MNVFSESTSIYSKNIGRIMLLSILIVLPLLLLHMFLTNYLYVFSATPGQEFVVDGTNAFLMIFFFLLAQIPFISFFHNEIEGEEKLLRRALLTFVEKGLPLYLFSILFTVAIMTGILFFIIPGIIILTFAFAVPYITIIRGQTVRRAFGAGLLIGKKRFFRLLGVILFVGFVEILLSLLASLGIQTVTDSYLAVAGTSILLNMIFLPFFVLLLTLFMKKWSEELSI
ncbi:hypothetical protein FLK61_38275 [Paenalkalicoccus suaedae]|uniref:Glycerophosphoryl diester phosphodiesterase membrane domain-containing protein n=1 Tax=Paenalkalicoccus suaedae TaxID=2592382 RepID=A0A859FJ61_9BACI|nr:hypothetical protein [Paenalkalicoccus suaedae]QKS72475.1 hypothetical protein FLK61_38275 [Paenalkalicoccus suaedae]